VCTPTVSASSPPPPATSTSRAAVAGPQRAVASHTDATANATTDRTVVGSRPPGSVIEYTIWASTTASPVIQATTAMARTPATCWTCVAGGMAEH
jgi:hypothetical protein